MGVLIVFSVYYLQWTEYSRHIDSICWCSGNLWIFSSVFVGWRYIVAKCSIGMLNRSHGWHRTDFNGKFLWSVETRKEIYLHPEPFWCRCLKHQCGYCLKIARRTHWNHCNGFVAGAHLRPSRTNSLNCSDSKAAPTLVTHAKNNNKSAPIRRHRFVPNWRIFCVVAHSNHFFSSVFNFLFHNFAASFRYVRTSCWF